MDHQYTMVDMEDPLDLAEVLEEAGLAEVVDLAVAAFCMVGDRLILHNQEKKEIISCREETEQDRWDRDHKQVVV
jgi:hypothetical protein